MLYASKLALLMAVNAGENVTWRGPHRKRPLQDVTVFPRPEAPLKIWLGTGGSPDSVYRAVELGLPMFLGVLGGTPEHWAQYGHAYRAAWAEAGHPAERADIAVAVHGFVAESGTQARSTYLEYEHRMMAEGLAELGRPAPSRAERATTYGPDGMVFVGSPDEVADRILHLHGLLGHSRQILQMDVGGMPQHDFLRAIELLGTKVLPQIHAELTKPRACAAPATDPWHELPVSRVRADTRMASLRPSHPRRRGSTAPKAPRHKATRLCNGPAPGPGMLSKSGSIRTPWRL